MRYVWKLKMHGISYLLPYCNQKQKCLTRNSLKEGFVLADNSRVHSSSFQGDIVTGFRDHWSHCNTVRKQEERTWNGTRLKAFKVNLQWCTFVSQTPPPKGSLTFSNNATSWEPSAQTHETMGRGGVVCGYFSFEPQHSHVQRGLLTISWWRGAYLFCMQ